jgi:hypothetical protein
MAHGEGKKPTSPVVKSNVRAWPDAANTPMRAWPSM